MRKALPILLSAALLLGACAGAVPQAEQRTINVTGTGTVHVEPDIAVVSLGVQTLGPDVGTAVQENNRRAKAVMEALLELGVTPEEETTLLYERIRDNALLPQRPAPVAAAPPVPLIGREREWRLLEEAWTRGRVAILLGDAGMGKSRLVAEWLSVVDPDQVQIWQGRGLPYVQGVGYGIFRSRLQNAIDSYPPDKHWDSQIYSTMVPFPAIVLYSPSSVR